MKVVIDDKIPYIRSVADRLFEQTVYLPGAAISHDDVADADALIVRTRTLCNAALLHDTRVQLVVTATIGYDHLDTDFLHRASIAWTNCPGCNATSVAQYVRNALFVLQRQGKLDLSQTTVGIVGVGHVGSAVADALRPFGCTLLLNDPPRMLQEGGPFVSLDDVCAHADIITFHTPLTFNGPYATHYMADDSFFHALQRRPIIINAARGGVVCEDALLRALHAGQVRTAIIDTWENEPFISPALLQEAFIATPHVAGYSADGKANATRMALQAVCRHFGLHTDFTILPPSLPDDIKPAADPIARALQLYDPRRDSRQLKMHPEQFEQLRGNYPLRRETWNQPNIQPS